MQPFKSGNVDRLNLYKKHRNKCETDVWLTVHRNSVWIRNQLDVTFVLYFISLLQVAQHVSGNHVPVFRS